MYGLHTSLTLSPAAYYLDLPGDMVQSTTPDNLVRFVDITIHVWTPPLPYTHPSSLLLGSSWGCGTNWHYDTCVDPPTPSNDESALIACKIARSSRRRLFLCYMNGNTGHYHVTMTSHSDLCTWCHERKCVFSWNAKQACILARAHKHLLH